MASAADKAEQRIHEQRRLIEQKLTRLESRVKDDLSTAQSRGRERANDVTQSIPGRHQIERQVEQRPLTSMAAGLAAGIGLGMLSESVNLRGNGGGQPNRRTYAAESNGGGNGHGSSMLSRLAGPATVAVLGPIQDQLQEFVASALSGLSGDSQRSQTRPEGQIPAAAGSRGMPAGPTPSSSS